MNIVEFVAGAASTEALLGRPASRVLARFIAGAEGEIDALFAERARRREGDLVAEDKVRSALAGAVAESVPADQAVLSRARDRWLGKVLRQDRNIALVGIRAHELLLESSPSGAKTPPSGTFINRLEGLSADCDDDDLREILARVLAGELRAPGSCSLAALDIIGVMDQQLTISAQFCRSLFSDDWPHIPRANYTNVGCFEAIAACADAGIIRSASITEFWQQDRPNQLLRFNEKGIMVGAPEGLRIEVAVHSISRPGREVLRLLHREPSDAELRSLARAIWEASTNRLKATAGTMTEGANSDVFTPFEPEEGELAV